MKNYSIYRQALTILTVTAVLAIFVTRPAAAQDKPKQDSKKTVMVKIVKDLNGKTTVVDTVFSLDKSMDSKEMHGMIKDLEKNLQGVQKEMKQMKYEIALSMADSGAVDSLEKSVMKVYTFGDDDDSPEGEGIEQNYTFDIPCTPECMEMPDCMGLMRRGHSCNAMQGMQAGSGESTLSDLLGDIPMERVKSYSIKDRKNGKRIIIDIDDAPLMENHDRIIYIQHNSPMAGSHAQGKRAPKNVRVIVKTDDGSDKPEKEVKPEKSE